MNRNLERPFFLFFGVMLLSVSMLIFEITLTKIFSVTLWYHFAYFIVSLSLFGIGAGGIISFVFQGKISRETAPKIIALSNYLFAVAAIVCLILILNLEFRFGAVPMVSGLTKLALLYVICSMPFVLFGFSISLTIRNFESLVSRVYAFDLAGSAAGCLIFLLLISRFSGPAVGLLAAMAALGSSLLLGFFDKKRPATKHLAAVAGLVIFIAILSGATSLFTVKHSKSHDERDDLLFEKWSALARISVYPMESVYPGAFSQKSPDRPFGWGMSRSYAGSEPVEQLWIEQDSCAGSPITKFDGDLSKIEHVKYDVSAFSYHIKPFKKAFIIGSGGGRDVLAALSFDVEDIHACDINPIVVGLVRERYSEFAGDIYNHPRVRVDIGDARNSIRHSPEKYDLIQISMIDSFAATTAGAFAMSENSIYTVEAFVDYMDHLSDDGIMSFTRFLLAPRQTLRVVSIARAALEKIGIKDASKHVVVVSTAGTTGMATTLVKKTPFRQEELLAIREAARRLQFTILHDPGKGRQGGDSEILYTKTLEEFIDGYHFDVRPSTDDRPFFFQFAYFSSLVDLLAGRELPGASLDYVAVAVIAATIVFTTVLTALFYFLPIKLSKKVGGIPAVWGAYFMLIGMGFMFVEIPFLQKGSLYLGHPTYSFSVVLFSMLLFGSVGSFLSEKINAGRVISMVVLLAIVTVALLLVVAITELVFPATLGWPFGVRVTLIIVMLALVSTPMGFPFPLGIACLGRQKADAIPWAWAMNGAASVLGSVLAMAAAMAAGYRIAFFMGAASYALAAVVLLFAKRSIEE